MTAASLTRWAATRILGAPAVSHALRALASARGHRLVLVYHRLDLPGRPSGGIVPSVPVDVFKAQIQALGEVVHLAALDEVLFREPRSAGADVRKPSVALTFDDDLTSHAAHALPILRDLGVPAAFFLSGRALHGLGPYWFQHLETLLALHGEARTATLLGLSAVHPGNLALACEQCAEARRRVSQLAAAEPTAGLLDRSGIAALAAAGMTVGFHTVDHDVLPNLDDAAMADAITRGRNELSAITGSAVRYFAYPTDPCTECLPDRSAAPSASSGPGLR